MQGKPFSSVDWRYLFRESVLILGLSYLFMLASTHNGLVSFAIFSTTIALFALILIFWIIKGQKISWKKEIPILGFFAVLGLSAAFSIDPRRSVTEVWLIAAASFLFLLSSELVNRGWQVDLWVKALLVVGAVLMIFTWREAIVWYQQWFAFTGKLIPDISYRLPAPNFLAVFLNLLLMVAAATMLFVHNKFARGILIFWALSALGLIYLTSSRGGWLGTVAGLGTIFLVSAFSFHEQRRMVVKWFRRHRFALILIVIGAIAAAAVFAWVFIQQSNQPTHAKLGESRSFLWNPAFSAFLRSPVIGSGPYTYISFFIQQQSMPPSPIYLYAHSIYIDLLSGSGIIGLAVFLVVMVLLVMGLIKRIGQSTELEKGAAMGALAALAAFLVHGFVDSVHHTIPTVAWLFAIVLGVGAGGNQEQGLRRVSFSWLLGLGLVAAGIINLWAGKPLSDAVAVGNSGLWQEARMLLQEVELRDDRLAIVPQQAGLVESQIAEQGDNQALQDAINHFESATQLDPWWGLNYANLGVLYRAQGDLLTSADRLNEAVRLAPQSALFQLNLGVTLEAMGQQDLASQAYQAAVKLQPEWQNAYFWRETPFRQSLFADVADGSGTLSLEEAETERVSQPLRLSSYLNVIPFYMEAEKLEDAAKAIEYGKLTYSSKEEERLLLRWYEAELAAANGDYGKAAQIGDETIHRYLQQGVYGPGTFGFLMYNQLAFRRPSLLMEVVPQTEMILLPDAWGNRLEQTSEWYMQTGDPQKAESLKRELLEYIPDWNG